MAGFGKEAKLTADVRLERHAQNQYLDLVWLDDKSGSEQFPLNGLNTPVQILRPLSLPQGEYEIMACVERPFETFCTPFVHVSIK